MVPREFPEIGQKALWIYPWTPLQRQGAITMKRKTNKAAAKRLKLLSSGKIKRKKCNRRHLLECKNHKRKRHAGTTGYVHSTDLDRVRQLLAV
jgi:large subunit ribosomal protein L35